MHCKQEAMFVTTAETAARATDGQNGDVMATSHELHRSKSVLTFWSYTT